MKTPIPSARDFQQVMDALLNYDIKSATKYISPKLVARATWRHKPSRKNTREEMVVTFGAPNYLEAHFVKIAIKAEEPFPIKRVQHKAWPKKKKAK